MIELKDLTTYQAGVYQARAFRALKHMKNHILEPYDMTMMQWLVLGLIIDSGDNGIRTTRLAEQLDTTQAFITNTVNALETKKMIRRERDSQDSRAHCVVFNQEKNELVIQIEEKMRKELRNTIYKKVTPEELRIYMNVLAKFADHD